jgi:hypothetical protein
MTHYRAKREKDSTEAREARARQGEAVRREARARQGEAVRDGEGLQYLDRKKTGPTEWLGRRNLAIAKLLFGPRAAWR